IIVGNDFKRATQFKVANRAISPNQESVAFGWILGRGLAGDSAVLDKPQFGMAFPASEIFAIKDALENAFALGIVQQSLIRPDCAGHQRRMSEDECARKKRGKRILVHSFS